MAVDPQHPRDIGRDLAVEVDQCGGDLVELVAALWQQYGLSGVEEYFGLEHEAIADDADVRPVAEDLPQAAKEFRAIARQLLDPLRQRHVEALAEISELGL